MGFPDTFKIPVSDTRAYKQFGNSVVVPVMKAVAEAMRTHIVIPNTTKQKSRQSKV
jgi:DNA (cytosine-5)-methyltransferase 1